MKLVSEGLINPSPTAHDASWNQTFHHLSCTDIYFFLNALKVTSLLKQWHWCCVLRMVWKPGFDKQDSLTCILVKQDPLDSFCLFPRFQVWSLSYPSLYVCQVLFVFSSLRFCCYLWKSSRVYSTQGSVIIKLHHPSVKSIYTSSHLINFILYFLSLLRFRVTKDLGLPSFWNGSSFLVPDISFGKVTSELNRKALSKC